MNFGKRGNAIATLQCNSLMVHNHHSNNRGIQSYVTNMLNRAFRTKVFPTRHFNPVFPELFAGLEPNWVMPIAGIGPRLASLWSPAQPIVRDRNSCMRNTRNLLSQSHTGAATIPGDTAVHEGTRVLRR